MAQDKNPKEKAKNIFNFIASIYNSLDKYVKKRHEEAIKVVINEIDLKNKTVLDVGTGTGAWASLFYENGVGKVHGVDFAEKMINHAREKYSEDMTFSIGDAENLDDFGSESYDIVTSSFVLHGVKQDSRKTILNEMKRITSGVVIINDFFGKTNPITRLLEYLEKSDYINFKKNFLNELNAIFPYTRIFDLGKGSAIYMAKKN